MATATASLRADAERNRVRVLRAAHRVISRDGAEARMQAIADEAGVGVGTLYRGFGTKEALLQAVLGELADAAVAGITEAAEDADPWAAFAGAVRALAERLAEGRGLLDALEPQVRSLEPVVELRARLLATLGPVLARAQDAGAVRGDVTVTDVVPMASLVTRLPAPMRELEPLAWERFLAVMLDGLRPHRRATALPGRPLPERFG
jgi:AcrR family transcriptional regulator